MRKKIALAAFIIACFYIFGEENSLLDKDLERLKEVQNKESSELQGETDEVEIDLGTEIISSETGINLKYGSLKMKAYEFQRDQENNIIKINGDVIIEAEEGQNKAKIETRDAEVSLDGDYAKFYDSRGYLDLGNTTGAEAPNNKIYFGGETTEYKKGDLWLNNAWFTTDPKVLDSEKIDGAGYHLLVKKIVIEPDKKVVFRDTDLYIGGGDVLPFAFPWYAVNIRQGSEVPLFPMWGTDEDYGWYTSWGVLYGDRDSWYRGGFAPKFGDTMGVLIGRWENWYDTGSYGSGELNLTDFLVYKKDSSQEDRWDIEHTHNYISENGSFQWKYRNATANMVDELENIRDDKEDDGEYSLTDLRPDGGDSISFFSLDTKFDDLGNGKDTSFYGKVKLIDDKDAYQEIVDDRLGDMDYDEELDHDLFADTGFKKDNENYKISGYYQYLNDRDPGSAKDDLQSEAKNFGFELTDKKKKAALRYDEKAGDEYRTLRAWERDPNLDTILDQEYSPWTVSKYSKNNSQNLYGGLGEYTVFNTGANYKMDYTFNTVERELDLVEDPFRETVVQNNIRDTQYNRFENMVYEDKKEDKIGMELSTEELRFAFAAGRAEEEFWDREGIYNYTNFVEGEGYKKYVNKSDFYEAEIEKKDLELGFLGTLGAKVNLRDDQYDVGYNPYAMISTGGGDETLREQFTVTLENQIYDNSSNEERKADIQLKNNFTYFYQDYQYKDGDDQLGTIQEAKEIRLKNKDKISQYKDTVSFGLGNTETNYTMDYRNISDASDKKRKKRDLLKNNLEFKIDDKKAIVINYNLDKNYTDENLSEENYNYFHNDQYGIDYYIGNNKMYYKRDQIDYKIWNMEDTDDSREKLSEDILGYELIRGLDKWQFEFVRGEDQRDNDTLGEQEIDVDNQIYSVAYLNGGDVEHYYKATYENYDHKEDPNNIYSSDVVSFKYEYRDKRFTEDDLEKYGTKEFEKEKEELTVEDLERIKEILEDRENSSLNFNLTKLRDERMDIGEYKRKLALYMMLQRNKERYSESNSYWDSMEEIQARIYYSYNRIGVGYEFDQEAGYNGSNWEESERDHEFSLQAKFGKPTEGWRVKSFLRMNENLSGSIANRELFDAVGVELAKEKGYYEWAVAATREYVSTTDDYEWEVGVQFTLLTFPNMPIFGGGAKNDGESTSPQTYLFDGVKVDDLD